MVLSAKSHYDKFKNKTELTPRSKSQNHQNVIEHITYHIYTYITADKHLDLNNSVVTLYAVENQFP